MLLPFPYVGLHLIHYALAPPPPRVDSGSGIGGGGGHQMDGGGLEIRGLGKVNNRRTAKCNLQLHSEWLIRVTLIVGGVVEGSMFYMQKDILSMNQSRLKEK